MKTLLISIGTVIAILSLASFAHADLGDIGVNSMYTDSETQFRLFLRGGDEHDQSLSGRQIFSDDEWIVNISVNLEGPNEDSVHVTGTAWHVKPPDNSGFGPIVEFDVMIGSTDEVDLIKFNKFNEAGFDSKKGLTGEFHAEHSVLGDYFTFASTVDRGKGGIFGWTMIIEGKHMPSTPAPGALALLGMAGLVGRRRRRR